MPKPFKNMPSLLKYLETAPIKAIRLLSDCLASKGGFEPLSGLSWPDNGTDLIEAHRQVIKDACTALPAEVATSLDGHASKIIKLSEGKGIEAVRTVEDRLYQLDTDDLCVTDLFDAQPDALGRATVLFAFAPDLFSKAELFFHSEYYRNFGKLYDAFDIDSDGTPTINWDDDVRTRLEQAVNSRLSITGNCRIEYVPVDRKSDNGQTTQEHIFLIRHAGDRSSVQDTKDDLSTEPLYYTPPVNTTIVVQPSSRSIELFCEDRSVRQALASTFANTVLQSTLSERPVTLRQYNLSRFYTSLALDQAGLDALGVNDVRVVEAEARPKNFGRRVIVKVNQDDEIEDAIDDFFGGRSIFHDRLGNITRIVLNIRYYEDNKLINLPITLSTPNRCNLGSKTDPRERDIGTKVLTHYDILTPVAQLQDGDEGRVIDALLKIFESGLSEVRLRQLQAWRANIALLQAGGFLKPKGPATDVVVTDDEGHAQIRVVKPQGSRLVTRDPVTGALEDVDPDDLIRYDTQPRWVAEFITKALSEVLKSNPTRRQDDPVADLGKMTIGEQTVALYLARQTDNAKHRNSVETYLRGQGQAPYGIVFTATDTYDEYLGPNVVIGLREVMTKTDSAIQIDIERISQIWVARSHRALSATTVELVRNPRNLQSSATLYISGRDPWSLNGEKQILVVERLVNAYHSTAPVVQARDLFQGMSSDSPGKLFGKDKTWQQYIGHPEGRSHGWTLLA